MAYVKILAVIALIGSATWVGFDPGFEPVLALVGSLSALVTAFVVEKRSAQKPQQHQSVSESSVGVQAGGNVSLGDIGGEKHGK